MNMEVLLKSKGHQVAIYTMDYPGTLDSDFSSFFSKEVSFFGSLSAQLMAAKRAIFGSDIKKDFERLLVAFKPDIIHLHNVHSYLSPIVAEIGCQNKIPVVWTLHDYKLLCPAYSCLCRGEVCEKCYQDKTHVIRERCMKNSLSASIVAYMEAIVWNKDRMNICTTAFICPSQFIANKMIQGGFSAEKMKVVNNFIPDIGPFENASKDDYYCYVGRLSTEKGVQTLIEAAQSLPYTLKIVGGGPLADELRALARDVRTIEFLGHQPFDRVKDILSKAKFSIIPSECYENNPLSVIESLSMGTPVLGANMGGIPELIDTDSNGLIFEAKSVGDLQDRIEQMMAREFDYAAIAQRARDRFSADTHYQKLMAIYKE